MPRRFVRELATPSIPAALRDLREFKAGIRRAANEHPAVWLALCSLESELREELRDRAALSPEAERYWVGEVLEQRKGWPVV